MITTVLAIALQTSVALTPVGQAAYDINETISEQEKVCMELGNSKETCAVKADDTKIRKSE